ncbi:hypothetical protein [Nocardiopsis potens]|uniref:hypothetical protein n=1 Tax=Nocardiopsis potens TaxID=1246458 RepID=UPI000345200D|nr:hypothetical protein [Nocardiopsis potens]
MRRSTAALTTGCAALLLAGCGPTAPGSDEEPPTPPSPSSMEGDTAELQTGFEELSGLILPDNASELEITGQLLENERPRYVLRFVTTRGGAEVICTADNLSVYTAHELPGEEERQVFDYQEKDEEIAESVRCEGSNPQQPRVQRLVSVVFPEEGLQQGPDEPDGEDVAVVYAQSVLWPKR